MSTNAGPMRGQKTENFILTWSTVYQPKCVQPQWTDRKWQKLAQREENLARFGKSNDGLYHQIWGQPDQWSQSKCTRTSTDGRANGQGLTTEHRLYYASIQPCNSFKTVWYSDMPQNTNRSKTTVIWYCSMWWSGLLHLVHYPTYMYI